MRRFWDIESLGIMNDTEPNTGVEIIALSYDELSDSRLNLNVEGKEYTDEN